MVSLNGRPASALIFRHCTGVTAPTSLLNGDGHNIVSAAQLLLGYSGTAQYPHFIHTQHNGGVPAMNSIDFYTFDGSQNGVFPSNAVLGLSIENGHTFCANSDGAGAHDQRDDHHRGT